MPERRAPTHEVVGSTDASVTFDLPSQRLSPGEDRVSVTIGSVYSVMSHQDWQQFVACVNKANEQVSKVFDAPGRWLGGKVA